MKHTRDDYQKTLASIRQFLMSDVVLTAINSMDFHPWSDISHRRMRVIQNSIVKIANGPLTCADAGRGGADKRLLNNPRYHLE